MRFWALFPACCPRPPPTPPCWGCSPSRGATENRTEGPKCKRDRENRYLTWTWGPDCNLSLAWFDDRCFNTVEKVNIYFWVLRNLSLCNGWRDPFLPISSALVFYKMRHLSDNWEEWFPSSSLATTITPLVQLEVFLDHCFCGRMLSCRW